MRNGELLKIELGLENLPNVKISRVNTGGSLDILLVVFDSRRPSRPLTSTMLRNNPRIVQILRYPFKKQLQLAPFIPIEFYYGGIITPIYVVVDLAGWFKDPKKYKHFITSNKVVKNESTTVLSGKLNKLKEYLSMSDFTNSNETSELTKRFKDERRNLVGNAIHNTYLVEIFWDQDVNPIFRFITKATPKYKDGYKYKETNPYENFDLVNNDSKTYTIEIKVLNFMEWLDTYPNKSIISKSDIKEIFDVSNIQVFSSDPSFHWQGINYNLSQVDASIYPTTIAPTVWKDRHGDGEAFATKHLSQLFDNIPYFREMMGRKMTAHLRKIGLINNPMR